ncbi:hypothetical protein PI124_g6261 [Phytophthora idaei]|nr:hypothetical protein PI125_g18397 [Phytophthora idaei]KAG3140259.1 hypothetical protein PI126_g16098 [Phytophthora idaei]KAG3249081.1 hypothetical protein PI124_g6261 [Phytophthora idaei]
MHSKVLAVLGLWVIPVILQAADARAPAEMAPHRQPRTTHTSTTRTTSTTVAAYKARTPRPSATECSEYECRKDGDGHDYGNDTSAYKNGDYSSGKGYSYVNYPQLLLVVRW